MPYLPSVSYTLGQFQDALLEGKQKRGTNPLWSLNDGLWYNLRCYYSFQNNKTTAKQRDVSYLVRETKTTNLGIDFVLFICADAMYKLK